ncbi:MAG: DUF4830 domain-containing protein [Acutalibacteraceae bacterium]|jgi:hypothetical protein|nr:DUF4830 domain-containing protein [Acutalibacteraceae bacterium]
MKLYFVISKKNLAVILAAVIIGLILIGQFFTAKQDGFVGSTNAKRVEFLKSLGLAVNETPTEVKNITIPENFGEVYKNYNNLQIESGFNLEKYKGKSAQVYTYSLENETVAHLIVCNNKIVGGDISDNEFDGKITALKGKEK